MLRFAWISYACVFLMGDRCIDLNKIIFASEVVKMESMQDNLEIATLGAGCFWCVEAVFLELKGIEKVTSGYMGGHVENPTYREVCDETTGHAEVAQITFDPNVISFEEILDVFWTAHDPTTFDRQGNDVGSQYRSSIFYHNEMQKDVAEKSRKAVATLLWSNPIVTEITPASKYYIAEDYHQNYYALNSDAGYCRMIINPKLEKIRKKFAKKLKN